MKIKLTEDVLTGFKDIADTDCGIEMLIRRRVEQERRLWEALRKKYNYEFAGARIDHVTCELVLPFEDEKQSLA